MDSLLVLACIILIGSAGVACFRRPVHCLLSLMVVLLGTAAIFASLDAHFLALAEIMLYGGAIAVLFLFLIMLINAGNERFNLVSMFYWCIALLLTVVLGIKLLPEIPMLETSKEISFGISEVGLAIFSSHWVFTLEVVAVLLTAALVGAVVLAMGKKEPKQVEDK